MAFTGKNFLRISIQRPISPQKQVAIKKISNLLYPTYEIIMPKTAQSKTFTTK